MRRNRILYGVLFLGVTVAAFIYADPFMFMAMYALAVMPVVSLVLAVITLFGLKVRQKAEGATVVKGQESQYSITLDNRIPFGLGSIRCIFQKDHFAVETDASAWQFEIYPFMKPCRLDINFTAKYRGTYQLGLHKLEVADFLRLFRLRRKMSAKFEIVAYPRITDTERIQPAVHLLSKAPSNLTAAQEDYADYTDVRPYGPSDPLKKVHWKLTAKKGEWIVKNYQPSVLNSMTVLLDSNKPRVPYKEAVILEDTMIEHTVGLLRSCLNRQIPVDLHFGRNVKETCRHIGAFGQIYSTIANLKFECNEGQGNKQNHAINDALTEYLSNVSHNANIIILASQIDLMLYEQIQNATRSGHYIAVMYFRNLKEDESSKMFYERLKASGLECVKI